jgi:hypothetical protein
MTKTMQSISPVLSKADMPEAESEAENMRLLLSIFNSLSNLQKKLSRLNFVIKNIETDIYRKTKGEAQ